MCVKIIDGQSQPENPFNFVAQPFVVQATGIFTQPPDKGEETPKKQLS